jgi:predicted HicB family RNase H-like nuclease
MASRERKLMAQEDGKKFTFRIPPKLYKKLKRAADKERRSLNQWLVLHFEEFFKKTTQYADRGLS